MFKKFLIRVAIFGLIIIASLAGCEAFVRSLDNPYKTKARYLQAHASDVETLILGNSHTFFGVRPDLIPGHAFNLANVSQTLRYDRELLERYAPEMPRLKTVILYLGYTSLYDVDLEDTDEWFMCINYRLYLDLQRHSRLSKYGFEISNFPVFAGKIKSALGMNESRLECDSLGHSEAYNLDRKYEGWDEVGASTALRHTASQAPDEFDRNLAVLRSIIDYCRGRDIRVILVTTPEWVTYRENMDPERTARIFAVARAVAAEPGVEWFNHIDDSRFTADDFFDADHLSTDVGAAKFTRILVDEMTASR